MIDGKPYVLVRAASGTHRWPHNEFEHYEPHRYRYGIVDLFPVGPKAKLIGFLETTPEALLNQGNGEFKLCGRDAVNYFARNGNLARATLRAPESKHAGEPAEIKEAQFQDYVSRYFVSRRWVQPHCKPPVGVFDAQRMEYVTNSLALSAASLACNWAGRSGSLFFSDDYCWAARIEGYPHRFAVYGLPELTEVLRVEGLTNFWTLHGLTRRNGKFQWLTDETGSYGTELILYSEAYGRISSAHFPFGGSPTAVDPDFKRIMHMDNCFFAEGHYLVVREWYPFEDREEQVKVDMSEAVSVLTEGM